jgi:Holliday junction resolvase RusA-like endonuclease
LDTVEFTVPGKPRGKQRHATNRFTGRNFTPKQTVMKEREVAQLYRLAARGVPLMTGTVRIWVEAVFAVPKSWATVMREAALEGLLSYTGKPDADNILKLVMDALNGVAWVDDSQVHPEKPIRRYGEPERVEVRLEHVQAAGGVKSPAERRREKKVASGMVGRKTAKRRVARNSSASELLAIGRRLR